MKDVRYYLDLFARAQEMGLHLPCPRCGKNTMDETLTRNALSRRYDIYVCDDCGIAEALEDFSKAVKNESGPEPAELVPKRKETEEWVMIEKMVVGKYVPPFNVHKISVEFNCLLTMQSIDDIMYTALEGGGIVGWCEYANIPHDEQYLGETVAEQIARGGTVFLFDKETDERYVLTLAKFIKGFVLAFNPSWIDCEGALDTGSIDADAADCIIQNALFGEVVFS